MKPTLPVTEEASHISASDRRFPITDFNYHAAEMGAHAHYTSSSNSFRVTREYFDKEAPRDFLSESAVFAVIMLTAAMPLLSGIHAIVDLISH